MVCGSTSKRKQQLTGIVTQGTKRCAYRGGFDYNYWVFTGDGNFELLDDGGYVNWCFAGSFVRSGHQGKKVQFNSCS